VIVSSVAFTALLKFAVNVWWSLLFAPVAGVGVLALVVAYGYVVDLTERFRRKKPARPEERMPPDGSSAEPKITP